MTRHPFPLFTIFLLVFALSACSNPDRLDVETFTGRWEAIEVDGNPPPEGRVHYLDFAPDTCRFHGVERTPDGGTAPAHDYTRACAMEKHGNEWRLIFQRDINDYLTLRREQGIVSLILPPGKAGTSERVLSRLRRVTLPPRNKNEIEVCRPGELGEE